MNRRIPLHVMTPEGESLVDLTTLTEIKTGANRKQLAKAITWATQHQAELLSEWQRLNPE